MSNAPSIDYLWQTLREEAAQQAQDEPMLASFYHASILNHETLESALSFHLANKLDGPTVPAMLIRQVFEEAFKKDSSIGKALREDMQAYKDRDAACDQYTMPFLYFKGYHALQSYRVAHWLWLNGRNSLALFFQNRMSEVFDVDIHPGAKIGAGIMIDHATGVVIGETAVVGNNVSMLHSVTLGGTGCQVGDRHPKIGDGVLISAGAKILGNVSVGEGAKIGAGSLVLQDVAPHTTVVGVPAKVVGKPKVDKPALDMDHQMPSEDNK